MDHAGGNRNNQPAHQRAHDPDGVIGAA
jgi:hypothetical protein